MPSQWQVVLHGVDVHMGVVAGETVDAKDLVVEDKQGRAGASALLYYRPIDLEPDTILDRDSLELIRCSVFGARKPLAALVPEPVEQAGRYRRDRELLQEIFESRFH